MPTVGTEKCRPIARVPVHHVVPLAVQQRLGRGRLGRDAIISLCGQRTGGARGFPLLLGEEPAAFGEEHLAIHQVRAPHGIQHQFEIRRLQLRGNLPLQRIRVRRQLGESLEPPLGLVAIAHMTETADA